VAEVEPRGYRTSRSNQGTFDLRRTCARSSWRLVALATSPLPCR